MERDTKVMFEGKETEGVELEFKALKEDWNKYEVSDGSVIQLKDVVMKIIRLKDKYDPEGSPIYVIKTSPVINISAPEQLKKK